MSMLPRYCGCNPGRCAKENKMPMISGEICAKEFSEKHQASSSELNGVLCAGWLVEYGELQSFFKTQTQAKTYKYLKERDGYKDVKITELFRKSA